MTSPNQRIKSDARKLAPLARPYRFGGCTHPLSMPRLRGLSTGWSRQSHHQINLALVLRLTRRTVLHAQKLNVKPGNLIFYTSYTTSWMQQIISRFNIIFTLFIFACCSPNEVTIAFLDIDDSFTFSSNTRLIIQLGDPHPNNLMINSPEGNVYFF
jgi:hypothetical protein